MRRECSTHKGGRRRRRKRRLLRPRSMEVDKRIIFGWILQVQDGVAWIAVAQDNDQRRALVKTAMDIRVPYDIEKFLCCCSTGGFSIPWS
jgi:hypothetical protein